MKTRKSPAGLLRCLALTSTVSVLIAQQAIPLSTTVPDSNAQSAQTETPVQLSPFEVQADNKGYFGANTTSGTRLNSKIEDLAASITVITKQQMDDFAMLDINDMFAYEAGTEGIGQYTNVSFDQNGAATDNTTMAPNQGNRVRGLGPANTTFGNFETSGRVPIDPLNLDAVEISRGPNSSIFGIGNTAGSVNSVPAAANLRVNRAQVTFRVDSNEGYRTTLDVNRVLKPDVLAVRGSVAVQRDGYALKPSGINSARLNAMLRYQPFKKTTLNFSFTDYRMHGQRPNYVTPSDAVTDWIANGRPDFNPVTQITTSNGVQVKLDGNILRSAQGNILSFVDQGKLTYMTRVRGSNTNDPNTDAGSVTLREANFRALYPNQPFFTTAMGVHDKSIYDWSSINLAAANYYSDSAQLAYATLDQIIFATQRQRLAGQLGWFRESTESFSRIAVGTPRSAGNSNPLEVDVNNHLVDGSVNPYFGRLYILSNPYDSSTPLDRDTYRGQLAYHLDFQKDHKWTHWLGTHDVSAYAEYKQVVQRRIVWKDTFVDNHSWMPANVARGSIASNGLAGLPVVPSRITPPLVRLYVGDAKGANVDYGSSYFPAGTYNLGYGTPGAWTSEPVQIGSAIADGTGVTNNNLSLLKAQGVVWQGHFLGDRIVPTFGWRHDESYTKIGGPIKSPDGINIDWASFNSWDPGDWTKGSGPTKTSGVVVKPLHGVSLFYNKSDSFRPTAPRQNLYLQLLPNPNGVGEDYGIAFDLFDGKLVVRVNRYKTQQLDTPNGPSATYVNRIRRIDFNIPNAGSPATLADTFNLQRLALSWVQNAAAAAGQTLTAAQTEQKVADIMQLPVEYTRDPRYQNGAADDVVGKGTEIELNYNPTSAWTMKLNVTQQETINARVAPDLAQWVNERLPVWQSIIDPTSGKPWYTTDYGGGSASAFVAANITSQIATLRATQGLSQPQIRKYRVNYSTNFRLSAITENKFLKRFNIGGAVRWESKVGIGYYGVQQPPDIVTAYDVNRPIYDKGNTNIDLLLGYRTRMFADKVNARFQLNVRNVQENGHLQPLAAYPNGVPYAFRIVEPRVFIFSATFDL